MTARTVLNLWGSAVSAQLDPAWRTGRAGAGAPTAGDTLALWTLP